MSRITSASVGERSSKLGVAGRRGAVADDAGELAALLGPEAGEGALVVALRIGVGDRPDLLAARDLERAGEMHLRRVGELGLERAAPVVARPGRERHGRVDANAGERRIDRDRRDAAPGLGSEGEQHGAVVQQQRVGAGVVRPAAARRRSRPG
jgi:hypothetical protein